MRNSLYVASAAAAALALVGCGVGTAKFAYTATEKCYGVAASGKNDCAAEAHACKGQALATGSPGDYLNLPLGTCAKLVNGSLTEV